MILRIGFVAALALALMPSIASASPRMVAKLHRKHARVARASHACLKAPVELVSTESATFPLAKCDGTASPAAVDAMSKLAGGTAGRRLDAKLIAQLEVVVDHFRGRDTPRVVLLSGFRPPSGGNYHSTGRALDFRIDGVENEALFAFCKTLTDTGCGYYPNSGFVHMDVRAPDTGHVAWTDTSKPGEAPRLTADKDTSNPGEPPRITGDQAREGNSLPPLPAPSE